MDEAEPDVLSYVSFLAPYRAKVYSTNPIERRNGKIEWRVEVVRIFPIISALASPGSAQRAFRGRLQRNPFFQMR